MGGLSDPPGLDLGALRRWLDESATGLLDGPLSADLVAGGKSNLTYRVTDGTRSAVVRRPPLGHVLATAHDMGREYRVISALQATPVPVPEAYASCTDESVIGAPFYVMSFVDGIPYRSAAELEALGENRTRAIGERLVDTLADLHVVDVAAVGLEDFGRAEGFLGRQVRRWGQQLDASQSRDVAGIDELRTRLGERVPPDSPGAVVHGDYRLDNVLVTATDEIGAVVDWEMATLGDPLTDVALLLTYQRIAALGVGVGVSTAPRAAGFPDRNDMMQRYAERTGRDLGSLGFHEALACFKLAVILEGIHYRHVHGQTLGEGFAGIGAMVEPLVEMGLGSMQQDEAGRRG
ncbi:MAG TPA: phosphotransferase family protein [Lapillicoccus sp.]|nr:phosphotransferase family protein [Lapillicoccus sp.]